MDLSMKSKAKLRPDYAVIVDPTIEGAAATLIKEFTRIQKEIGEIKPENIECLMAVFVEKIPEEEGRERKVRMYHMGNIIASLQMFQTLAKAMQKNFDEMAQEMKNTAPAPSDKDDQQ